MRARVVWVLVGAAAVVSGCEREPPVRQLDPELVESLGLQGDEVVHTITLGGRGTREDIVPPVVDVSVGEIVEFVTVDQRIHTITFPADSLSPQALAFLRSTRQASSPPLLHMGNRYVVTFENAPPGRYPFLSGGHGESSGGIIIVR